MSIFWIILLSIPALNLAWWAWADWRLRRAGFRSRWRWALAAFVALHLVGYAWVILARRGGLPLPTPRAITTTTYIWNMIILPVAVAATGVMTVVFAAWGAARRVVSGPPPVANPPIDDAPLAFGLTRRQALAGLAVSAPAMINGGGVFRGLSQLGRFRVRTIETPISGLPAELDGVTIAHVTDTHVGRFTRGPILDAIAAKVNELDPDFVAFTGDLIDFSLDDLPESIAFLRKLKPRVGMAICEGNHDLFQGREAFRAGLLTAGLPLLIDDDSVHTIRGREIQFLGVRWGGAYRDVRALSKRVRGGATPVLLVHHPHMFDHTEGLSLPLTLAGHTHGGQLMLTQDWGAGPAIFKYWSGLYRRHDAAALVVSNGVGNWFPLRVNAPAEIVRVVLRTA